MTNEQIDAALKICTDSVDSVEFFDATLDSRAGYEAALRALKAANERIAEMEHLTSLRVIGGKIVPIRGGSIDCVAQAAVSMGSVGT